MKHWWQRIVKDYLTFSRRERNGVFILIIVGVLIYFLPKLFQPKKTEINKEALDKDVAKLKISVDTSRGYKNYYRNDDEAGNSYLEPKRYNDFNNTPKGELFPFDPNTLDAAGWKRLGLRDKTIATIQKFTAKGFKFRRPEDIKRVYGLRPEDADRLIPYVRIAQPENNYQKYTASTYPSNNSNTNPATTATAPVTYKPRIIDVNQADTSAFISLPGIGSKLALRIVNFRDRLGGFYSVNQVAETYGVPDSTFQKIKPRLQCSNGSVKKININEADITQLKSHPYIRYNLANAIINYRKQHGNFKSIEDIRKIDLITEEVYSKIAPYLAV